MKHLLPDEEIKEAGAYHSNPFSIKKSIAQAQYDLLLSHFPKAEDIRLMLVQEKFGDRTLNDIVTWIKYEIFGE